MMPIALPGSGVSVRTAIRSLRAGPFSGRGVRSGLASRVSTNKNTTKVGRSRNSLADIKPYSPLEVLEQARSGVIGFKAHDDFGGKRLARHEDRRGQPAHGGKRNGDVHGDGRPGS